MIVSTPTDILTFWRAAGHERWFGKDDAFDADIRARFGNVRLAAANGELPDWQTSDDGTLALLIMLDQFPRNLFRGSPQAFATDAQARDVAVRAIERGVDQRVDRDLRLFVYLPFEHAENLEDQQRSVALFEAHGDAEQLDYALIHRDIIARFGRFPHRNAVLGRATTPQEQAFLDGGGFAG